MKLNVSASTPTAFTHEGGVATGHQKPLTELERAVATCMLWENTFYEKGSEIAERISVLCGQVTAEQLAAVAIRARNEWKLRHVPLWLVRQMARLHDGKIVGDTIAAVVQRPDEATELLALYWKDGRTPIAKQVKRGLALAFQKWSAHTLSKWNRDDKIKLRDVLFLVHAKPKDEEQAATWKKLIAGELEAADTWEVALSAGADKKATWERLIREKQLGYMALLMNLRNMETVGVDRSLIRKALIEGAPGSKALPFRFVTAARHAPHLADAISEAMLASLADAPKLLGRTIVVVDVSGSMDAVLNPKSEVTRIQTAGALAALVREIAEDVDVFAFSGDAMPVKGYRGLALIDAFPLQPHGTWLGKSLTQIKAQIPEAARVVVVTDEQAHDRIIPCWTKYGYVINVAPYKPALQVELGWVRINGWSERAVDWIRLNEQVENGESDANQ